MSYHCQRCGSIVKIPFFSQKQKSEIWQLKQRDFPLFAIKKITDYSSLKLGEAKTLLHHLNKKYGKCHRCNSENLEEQNTICPKCNSLNLNWKFGLSFNAEFCHHSEFWLSAALELTVDKRYSGF